MEAHGDEIQVGAIHRNFLPEDFLCEHEPHEAANTRKYLAWIDQLAQQYNIAVKTMHAGDVYPFGDSQIHVLREPDPAMGVRRHYMNMHEDSCIVL